MSSVAFRYNRFYKLLVVIWVTIANIPYLQHFSPTLLNAFVTIGIYAILLFDDKRLLAQVLKILPFAILTILDFIVDNLLGVGETSLFVFLYSLLNFCLLPLVALEIILSKDVAFAKLLLICILICFIITGITTYVGCSIFPGASRALAAGYSQGETAMIDLYKRYNIAGFSYIYTLPLLCPLLFYIARDKRVRFYIRLLSVLIICGIVAVVVKSEYTTALLCVFISFFCLLINKQNISRYIGLLLLIILVFVLLREYIGDLFQYLAAYFDSESMSPRLNDVGSVLKYGMDAAESSDFYSRQEAYSNSWNAFLRSPIWGCGEFVDGHSFILRYLAKYGMIGFFLMLYVFKKLHEYSIKPSSNSDLFPFLLILAIIQVVIMSLNPLLAFNVFLVIIPLILLLTKEYIL